MKTSTFKHLLSNVSFLALLICATTTQAKDLAASQKTLANQNTVIIENAWVRPTIKGQGVGAAYMTLTSTRDTSLVKVESNVTKEVEIHSMSMEKGVMKMRMLETLPLLAGKPYKLEPGGFHLMLFDLKKPLSEGENIRFELTFKNKNGVEFKQRVEAHVKELSADDAHEHHH